jgi:hypothetical protein
MVPSGSLGVEMISLACTFGLQDRISPTGKDAKVKTLVNKTTCEGTLSADTVGSGASYGQRFLLLCVNFTDRVCTAASLLKQGNTSHFGLFAIE